MVNKKNLFFNFILSIIVAFLSVGIIDHFFVNKLLSNQISFTIKYPNNDGFFIFSSKSTTTQTKLYERISVLQNKATEVSYSVSFTNSEYLDLNFGSIKEVIELSNIKINGVQLGNPAYLINSIRNSTGFTGAQIEGNRLLFNTDDNTAKLTLSAEDLGLVVYNSVTVNIFLVFVLAIFVFFVFIFVDGRYSFIQANRIGLLEIAFVISFVSFIMLNNLSVFNVANDTNVQLIKLSKLFLSLKNNLWIIFACILTISISSFLKWTILKLLISVCVCLFVAIYIADLFSYLELHTHLVILDVIKYVSASDNTSALILHFLSNCNNWVVISFLISGVFYTYFQLFSKCTNNEFIICNFAFKKLYLEILLLLVAVFLQFIPQITRSDDYLSDNLIKSNYMSWNSNKNFSTKYLKELNYNHELFEYASSSADQHKNVILIVVESLTSSKSKYFSNLENKMPYLDKLANENISFINYYSNGSNSITGNYSIATNNPFVFNDTSSDIPSYLYENTIAKIFKKYGYLTKVFAAAKLVYGKKQVYIKSGFDYISDDKDPYYSGKPRYVFNGVSDDVLYENVISNVKNETDNFFYMLNTVTTHPPYLNPITGESSFDSTIEFAEKALETFVNQLEEANFFDNGILVIVGDHRSMTPISDLEYEKYGEWSCARMPLVIIDKEIKHLSIDDHLSHASLGSIIQYLSLPQVVMSKEQGNPFLHKKELVVFNQYSRRNEVFIRYGNDFETVLYLSGDDSYLSKSSGEAAFDNEIIGYIAWLRERVSDK